jgi:hypothetical protein
LPGTVQRSRRGGRGEVELEYAEVTLVRDGLIVRRDIYAGAVEALASVGLPADD